MSDQLQMTDGMHIIVEALKQNLWSLPFLQHRF